jgi:RNA polymerase sigma factor (TIGR02999 family)
MSLPDPRTRVTRALTAFEAGEVVDLDALLPVLYEELRALAGALLRQERAGHTLQPTALAHEAWLRLVDAEKVRWQGRAQFLALAARVMRRVLIDHARRRDAEKRGGGRHRITLSDATPVCGRSEVDLLALDEALTELAAVADRKARVVEYRYFSGMTMPEVAEALGISQTTAEDDWYFARAWLARRLAP